MGERIGGNVMKGLVLDGGGVFGIGQAQILSEIDLNKFDFMVGTSIGATNIGAIAANVNPSDLPDFFHYFMPKIFQKRWFKIHGLYCPLYLDDALNNALKYLVGDIDMGEIEKPIFITSVHFNTKRLKVFSNKKERDAFWPLWEVIRCSVSAPSYFTPWKGYIDGGVFVNNPSMVAVAAASRVLNCPLSEIEICSIGTGHFDNYKDDKKMWSILHWGVWLINALLDGASSDMSDYFVRYLPIKKYLRIDFKGDRNWRLDKVKYMYEAENLWHKDIQNAIKVISEF